MHGARSHPALVSPVSGDLRLGGRFQIEGNAAGTMERCDLPRSFTSTWEFGGEVSWIELSLWPAGDNRTRLELVHITHVDDARWMQFGPGAVGVGWDLLCSAWAAILIPDSLSTRAKPQRGCI